MDYIPYHSGSAGAAREGIPAFGEEAARFTAFVAAPAPEFFVKFRTKRFAPNHQITIRNETDGWEQDIYGTYFGDEWVFSLEKQRYRQGLEMKFVLDGRAFAEGFNLHLNPNGEHVFSDQTITFPPTTPRYRHAYDNLRTQNTQAQQDTVPANTDESVLYDTIIVGSGMGGGVLADALSDAGKRVLVLDAGSLLYPTHITNLPGDWSRLPAHHQVGHFNNEPGSEFLFGVQMNLGGRSTFWSGLIPRMHDWEMAAWPESIRNALTSPGGYARAETLMRKQRTLGNFQNTLVAALRAEFDDYEVEDFPRSRHQPNLDAGGTVENVIEAATGTFSSAALLLDSLAFTGSAGRDNLTINLNHLVTRVETNGRQATAVVCQDLVGNRERRYQGRQIVLAAGSLETPRIALRSGLNDPQGKIGVGLTDHPAFFSNTYELPPGSPFAGFENHAKVLMYHKAASDTDHPYNVELLVNPKYWDVAHADDDVWKQQVGNDQRTTVRLQFVFSSPLEDRNRVLERGEGQKLGVKVNRNLSGSHLFNEVRDLRNAILGFLGAPHNPDDGMHFGNEGTVHHAGGTMRLSDNGSGVVDQDLRLEAYDNLFVCDVSVFPMIPAANPSLTLSTLALRLADHLKS